MSIAQKLYQLQEIELEIESEEEALLQCLGQLGESEVVSRVRFRFQDSRQQYEGLEQKQHSVEWQVEDIEAKLKVIKEKLYSGQVTNSKELANLQQEENNLKAQSERLEERVLEAMEQVEVATADMEVLSSELGEMEREWRNQQQELSTEIEKLKKSISVLKEKRELALAGIDAGTVDFYYRLKKQKGRAVAKIEQGTCRSCRISLSTAELQRARGNQLVECNSCRRILFLE